MEAALDWTPDVTLEEGVRDIYEWAADELDADRAFVTAGEAQ
jgi:nucleoside-diphosphate-sugar epimerase